MASYPELAGKNAVVTGGSTGIGEAVARKLAEQGVNVVVVGRRNRESAERVAEDLRAMGTKSFAFLADVSKSDQVASLWTEIQRRDMAIDILVNCAGGFPQKRLLVETPDEEWDEIININLRSAFLCCKAAVPGMVERRWGRIVNVASEAARTTLWLTAAHYAAAKAGLLGLTRHLAREVAPYGVTVNATAPSTTRSPRVERVHTPESLKSVIDTIPMGRIAEAEEQADVILFLASEGARYITGHCIDVNGGKFGF